MADQEDIKREVARLRQHARDIQELARWLLENGEKLDEVPYASLHTTGTLYCTEYKDGAYDEIDIEKSKKNISKIARVFGTADKEFNYDSLDVTKKFGKGDTVKLRATVNREAVCTKKVVKKTYVKHTSDGYWSEEVEWDCTTPSILALTDER